MAKFKDRDKGSYPELYDELWDLRKRSDGVSAALMATYPMLTRFLGQGDPHAATGRFLDDMTRLTHSGDRTERAFAWSVLGSANVLNRMQEAAQHLHVGERRVRDLSDVGLLQYSEFAGSQAFHVHPIVTVLVSIDDERVDFSTIVYIEPQGDDYSDPFFKANGDDVELAVVEREQLDEGPQTYDVLTYATLRLDLPGGGNRCFFKVWRRGSVDTHYATNVISTNGEYACRTFVHDAIVTVSVMQAFSSK